MYGLRILKQALKNTNNSMLVFLALHIETNGYHQCLANELLFQSCWDILDSTQTLHVSECLGIP